MISKRCLRNSAAITRSVCDTRMAGCKLTRHTRRPRAARTRRRSVSGQRPGGWRTCVQVEASRYEPAETHEQTTQPCHRPSAEAATARAEARSQAAPGHLRPQASQEIRHVSEATADLKPQQT